MGRRAQILGQVADAWGDLWDVRTWADTAHGFRVATGWPHGQPRGRGGVGGPRVILTAELVAHLEAVRQDLRPMTTASLPLGRAQLMRLRSILGHDRKADRRDWWIEHAEELATMSFTAFGQEYGVTSSAAELMHAELFGRKRGRPEAWWKAATAADLLRQDLPAAFVADRLGRTVRAVWGARYLLSLWEASQCPTRD